MNPQEGDQADEEEEEEEEDDDDEAKMVAGRVDADVA
ncbi:hypothetical protein TRV_02468 [Trichophyton verrucosum HKI 0517]|uniref:Uncharacterized protein n=1 Tax=Trichophyton verrucosum (strain HKI 0517) TaxID=663202 RepID=D4D5U5_TRIVH|nr:uncharacterized protein TRV_02468 [Trichophyton verrucosum HKI 0517]EFE42748.1 hypothetical protein TRV_02468 [Trichophyton verrucosum HKI 0517]